MSPRKEGPLSSYLKHPLTTNLHNFDYSFSARVPAAATVTSTLLLELLATYVHILPIYARRLLCRPQTPFLPFLLSSAPVFLEQLYHQSPVMMLQQLVDTWIMELEGGATTTPPVVRVTEFPSPVYSDDGFWSNVSRCCCCSHVNTHNQVRGRRTGSGHSGAEEYPRE